MEKFLHYVSMFVATISEIFHQINTLGLDLINIRCDDPMEKIFFEFLGIFWIVLITFTYLIVAIAILSAIYKIFKKLTADKIVKIPTYGIIIQKRFSPERVVYKKKLINNNIKYVPIYIPKQYNVLVVCNGISETFNNKDLFLYNVERNTIPVVIVQRINRRTGDVTNTLELPE